MLNLSRYKKWSLLIGGIIGLWASPQLRAQTRSTVTQVFYKADGVSFCTGNVSIAWKTFYTSDGRLVQAGNMLSPVSQNGVFSQSLEAPASYTVSYQLLPSSCSPSNENWQVPLSLTTLSLAQVRAINPPPSFTNIPLSFLARTGAQLGQGICEQSNGLWAPGNCFGDSFISPFVVNSQGPWDNSAPNDSIIGGISTAGGMTPASVDHDRFLMTNVYGSYSPNLECCRVQGVTGDIHVPPAPTSTTIVPPYEACAVCGMIFSSQPLVNNVALSGFVVPTASGPEGTANFDHLNLTRVTGPCYATSWAHSINTIITVNGVDNFITGVTDCDHLTLAFDLGTGSGVPWFRRIYQWMENLGCSDDQPGATPAGPGYKHIQCMNEWDFGVYGTDSSFVALIFGIGGTEQPTGAHGIVINGGGNDSHGMPVRWNTALTLFDGCCGAFIEIGTAVPGASGTIPSLYYSRDSMGNVMATTITTDNGGSYIISTGTDATRANNPSILFRDTDNLNFAMTGTIGGARAQFAAFGNGVLVPGSSAFADLGTATPGSILWCTNCKDVQHDAIVAGTVCQSGGASGAFAIRHFDAWTCI